MPFQIITADITKLNVDAIVNLTDQNYSGGGGVDHLIHSLCGKRLSEALLKFPHLHLGEAKATESFSLPSKYIIHTSGPYWTGDSALESTLLGSCYRNSVALAASLGCKSIAFPLISSHGKLFPKEVALSVAMDALEECVEEYPSIDIFLVLYDCDPSLLSIVNQCIDALYFPLQEEVQVCADCSFSRALASSDREESAISEDFISELIKKPTRANLDKIVVDEPFGKTLSSLLIEKKMQHSDVYDELGMSNTGFWKILNGKSNPTKLTVFGIAIALKLSLDDTKELLMKAGYAINRSSLQDIILSSLINNEIYDRYKIDNLLYSLDLQPLPGAILD